MLIKDVFMVGQSKLRLFIFNRTFSYLLLIVVLSLMIISFPSDKPIKIPNGLIVKGRQVYINFVSNMGDKGLEESDSSPVRQKKHHTSIGQNEQITTSKSPNFRPLENTQQSHPEESCPAPTDFVGRRFVSRMLRKIKEEQVAADNPNVKLGGVYKPVGCVPEHKVAIIIPCRDRLKHLINLLRYLHPILQKQNLDYSVFVVEQEGKEVFNKGMIMNAAFLEITKIHRFDCVIFHDVDMIPEDDRIPYSCSKGPEHMSVSVNEFHYKLPYPMLIGGVFKIPVANFKRVNGYSNRYWGWGSEDDDLYYRIKKSGLSLSRPSAEIAKYTMIYHIKSHQIYRNIKLLQKSTVRSQMDGLNTLKYKLVYIEKKLVYTHIMVNIGKMPKDDELLKEPPKVTLQSKVFIRTTTLKPVAAIMPKVNETTKQEMTTKHSHIYIVGKKKKDVSSV